MTARKVIRVEQIRAEDVKPGDIIRLTPTSEWVDVYDADHPGQDGYTLNVMDDIFDEELGERYVVLRVTKDPLVDIGYRKGPGETERRLHTWLRYGDTRVGGQPAHWGVPFEYDDTFHVLRTFALVDVQIEVEVESVKRGLRFPELCAAPDPEGTGYGCSLADGHDGETHVATEDNASDGKVLAEWSR